MVTMANQYKKIFQAEGAFGFSLAGFIARMPNSMIFISLTLMLNSLGFSYSRASLVTATYITASALLSPQTAKLADRYGQSLIVAICTFISDSALILLLIASYLQAPIYILILLALFAGLTPNFGAMVRTRWSRLYSGSPYIRSAFAFESIVDEIVFMIGPVLAIAATTNLTPYAGLVIAICFSAIGAISFINQKASEPKAHYNIEGKNVLKYSAIRILATILFVFGVIYGAAELSTIAFCKELNKTAWSSLPLILYALASFSTGFAYGAKKHIKLTLAKQLLLAIAIAAIATIPFLFIHNIFTLCFALFCSGASCAPTIIIATALVEHTIPEKKLTEAISWVMTGLNLGTSCGYAVVSPLLDRYGSFSGFAITVCAGFCSLIIALICFKSLKETKSNS